MANPLKSCSQISADSGIGPQESTFPRIRESVLLFDSIASCWRLPPVRGAEADPFVLDLIEMDGRIILHNSDRLCENSFV